MLLEMTGHSGRKNNETNRESTMRTFQTLWLTLLMCVTAGAAEETRSYLCIADDATGFAYNKSVKKWRSGGFNVDDMRYILKRYSIGNGPKRWGVFNFGEADAGIATIPCQGDFNEAGVLLCENYSYFRFDRETSRFLYVYLVGYTAAGKVGAEGGDTPVMAIGKCSVI